MNEINSTNFFTKDKKISAKDTLTHNHNHNHNYNQDLNINYDNQLNYSVGDTRVLADLNLSMFESVLAMREVCSLSMIWATYLLCFISIQYIPKTENLYKSSLEIMYQCDDQMRVRFSRSINTDYARDLFTNFLENQVTYFKGLSYGVKKCQPTLEKYYKVLANYKNNVMVVSRKPDLAFSEFKKIDEEELSKLIKVLQIVEFSSSNDYTKIKTMVEKSR